MSGVIKVDNLSKSYGNITAVKNLSLWMRLKNFAIKYAFLKKASASFLVQSKRWSLRVPVKNLKMHIFGIQTRR